MEGTEVIGGGTELHEVDLLMARSDAITSMSLCCPRQLGQGAYFFALSALKKMKNKTRSLCHRPCGARRNVSK